MSNRIEKIKKLLENPSPDQLVAYAESDIRYLLSIYERLNEDYHKVFNKGMELLAANDRLKKENDILKKSVQAGVRLLSSKESQ